MRTPAPALLPVFRSRLVGDLLALILTQPERSWRLGELADRLGVPYQTVTGEIRRLEQAGLVTITTVGRSKLVTANTASPYAGPLTELTAMAFGPPMVLGEEFAPVAGIEALYLYGSWAARHSGTAGAAPADVDVLVVGHVDRDEVYEAARRAERRLGREVNAMIRSPEAWEGGDDAFTTTLKSSPLVRIPGPWSASLDRPCHGGARARRPSPGSSTSSISKG
jgi:DNA-binding transcriptional ArsR family regulator